MFSREQDSSADSEGFIYSVGIGTAAVACGFNSISELTCNLHFHVGTYWKCKIMASPSCSKIKFKAIGLEIAINVAAYV